MSLDDGCPPLAGIVVETSRQLQSNLPAGVSREMARFRQLRIFGLTMMPVNGLSPTEAVSSRATIGMRCGLMADTRPLAGWPI